MSKRGHPLPGSGEARHNEIPEHLAEEKGRGDDPRPVNQPDGDPVDPDGESYRYDDLGRGAGTRGDSVRPEAEAGGDDLRRDQGEHQDRGQSAAEAELKRPIRNRSVAGSSVPAQLRSRRS